MFLLSEQKNNCIKHSAQHSVAAAAECAQASGLPSAVTWVQTLLITFALFNTNCMIYIFHSQIRESLWQLATTLLLGPIALEYCSSVITYLPTHAFASANTYDRCEEILHLSQSALKNCKNLSDAYFPKTSLVVIPTQRRPLLLLCRVVRNGLPVHVFPSFHIIGAFKRSVKEHLNRPAV